MGLAWLACVVAAWPVHSQASAAAPQAQAKAQAPDLDADYAQYRQGLAALDALQWQKALTSFQAMSPASAQAEGALYWKAFTLYRAGQGRAALAPIENLRKSFPQSGWIEDAETLAALISEGAPPAGAGPKENAAQLQKALEDRINGDTAHAAGILRAAVFSTDLPGARQKALYFLTKETSKEAKDIVLQVAHGAANPDLQDYAISQLSRSDPQAVSDLYSSVGDNVKSLILPALSSNRESVRLMRIAASEKSDDLRFQALGYLVEVGTDAQVKQALQFENAADVKTLVETKLNNVHKWVADQLTTLKTAKDPRERRVAAVGLTRGGEPSTDRALVEAYASEKDPEVKGAIIFALAERKNFSALDGIEKNETNAALKLRLNIALDSVRNR
jgi:hypothetical protein